MSTHAEFGLLSMLMVVLCGAALAGAAVLEDRGADAAPAARADVTVTISQRAVGRPIAAGFVGLSLEYPAVAAYAGSDPHAVNPVLEQLIRNLAPHQPPVLRIGGDSADATWWPVKNMRRPAGVTYSLSPRSMAVTKELARATRARLIMGIDLEAGRPALALAEARAMIARIGKRALRALEIGNEPQRYTLFPFYSTATGRRVYARARGYDYRRFDKEFVSLARRMPAGVGIAGPTFGGYAWMGHLGQFIHQVPKLVVVTLHRYPLNRCFTKPGTPHYPTVPRLLTTFSSRGLAQGMPRYATIAHRHNVGFRVDEMNSAACGGKLGVSNTFAAALWALDAAFAMAQAGVDGVNFHTFPGAAYQLFAFKHLGRTWLASVRPEYYGLLMFAAAAPPRSHLLQLTTTGAPGVRAWATRGPGRAIRVTLINADFSRRHSVLVRAPQVRGATLLRLSAPSAYATGHVSLGARSFGVTATGSLGGYHEAPVPFAGGYRVSLPAASAAVLALPAT